jgi:hypothetical protein
MSYLSSLLEKPSLVSQQQQECEQQTMGLTYPHLMQEALAAVCV